MAGGRNLQGLAESGSARHASAAMDFTGATLESRHFLPNMSVSLLNCCKQATTLVILCTADNCAIAGRDVGLPPLMLLKKKAMHGKIIVSVE
jgi:hypothetical protein